MITIIMKYLQFTSTHKKNTHLRINSASWSLGEGDGLLKKLSSELHTIQSMAKIGNLTIKVNAHNQDELTNILSELPVFTRKLQYR